MDTQIGAIFEAGDTLEKKQQHFWYIHVRYFWGYIILSWALQPKTVSARDSSSSNKVAIVLESVNALAQQDLGTHVCISKGS